MSQSNPFLIGDTDYDEAALRELRKKLISIRDSRLYAASFDTEAAVVLSHAIGVLGAFIDEKYGKEA